MTAKKTRLQLGQAAGEADQTSTPGGDTDETKATVDPDYAAGGDTTTGADAPSGGDDTPADSGDTSSDADTPSSGDTPAGNGDTTSGGDGTSSSGDAPSGGDDTPSGGDGTPSGGDDTPSGGDGTPSGGDGTPTGGDDTPTGGDTPSGGGDTPSGGGDTPSGDGDDPDEQKTTKTWESGDWRTVPRKAPPYNGLKITAVYGSKASPDGVDVTFEDFTYSTKGVSSQIQNLTVVDGWTAVPPPPNPPKGQSTGNGNGNPNEPAPQFTVNGEVCIEKYVNGKFLRIRLSYGMPNQQREELGLIFSVD